MELHAAWTVFADFCPH